MQSRKLQIVLITMALIFVGYVLAYFLGSLAAIYPTLVMGLSGAAGLYFGANVTQKATRKSGPEIPKSKPIDEDKSAARASE